MAMSEQTQPVAGAAASTTKARTSFGILGAISLSHLLNDMIQSLILAIYPLLQSEFSLTFMQIGMKSGRAREARGLGCFGNRYQESSGAAQPCAYAASFGHSVT